MMDSNSRPLASYINRNTIRPTHVLFYCSPVFALNISFTQGHCMALFQHSCNLGTY